MANDLIITRTPLRAGALVTLRGTVDAATTCRVEAALREAAPAGEPLAIDLTSATVPTAAGAALLANAIRRTGNLRPGVRLVCPPGPFRASLDRAGLTRRIAVVERLADGPEGAEAPLDLDEDALGARTARRRGALLAHATVAIEARHGDPDLSLEQVARRLATSGRQLQRVFAELGGTTFRAELNAVRMQHAAELLQTTALPVAEIARRVGHRQPAQFAHAFRRHHGLSPTALRRAAHS